MVLHCDLRARWKVTSDLRFRAAISEPKASSFCRIFGDLAPSTRKSLAIAIVRLWCTKDAIFLGQKIPSKRTRKSFPGRAIAAHKIYALNSETMGQNAKATRQFAGSPCKLSGPV